MRNVTRTHQQGLSLVGLLFIGIIIVLLAILAAKIVPDVVEYEKIVANVKAISQDASFSGSGSIEDIREAYKKRAMVDQISAVKASDLDIVRNNGKFVVSFAYSKAISLGGPVSLVIDYQYSTQ
jgi:hypothetical protein